MTSLVLVDFDDTLVDTAPRFLARRERLFDWLGSLGFPEEEARSVHHDIVDHELLPVWGFGPYRLGPSFRDTYVRLCLRQGILPRPELARAAEDLASGIEDPSPPLPGAMDALRRLAGRHEVAIWTQSNFPTFQRRALALSGVPDIVGPHRILVAARKTPATFALALEALGAPTPATTWMIGNSMRHDVNPALANGAGAIRIRCPSEWQMDQALPLRPDVPEVDSFAEAVDRLTARGARPVSPT